MLSAEASDTGLVSAARCQFTKNDYPRVQRSPEPLPFISNGERLEIALAVCDGVLQISITVAKPTS